MPGNESEVLKFILSNKNHIRLNGIDKIKTIKVPKEEVFRIKSLEDLSKVAQVTLQKKLTSTLMMLVFPLSRRDPHRYTTKLKENT